MKSIYAVTLIVWMVAGTVDAARAAESDPKQEPKTPEAATAAPGETDTPTTKAGPLEPRAAGTGIAAMEKAAKAKKYLFALFWKEEDENTSAMRKTLAAAVKKVAARAESAEVNVADPEEKPMVDKFRLDFAPVPLLLAIAPNGVVTAGFATKVEEEDLLDAFATPGTEKCLKALEDNKLVFLCIQNAKTESNEEAMKGVREFAQDERFSEDTEIVVVDPADTAEAKLLTDFGIDSAAKEAVTVFLLPPGRRVGQFQGATKQEELVQSLMAAMSGFG